MVFYSHDGPHRFWFRLSQSPDSEMENELEWEELEVAGRRFQLSDPESDDGMAVLRFCQDGTWVDVFSDHPRNELLRIAESFQAVAK